MDGAFPSEGPPASPYNGSGGGGRGRGRGFRGTAENAKTKLCTRWLSGDCRFGDRCNFAHGEHELRQLPARPDGGRGGPAARGRGYGVPAGRFGNGGGRGYGRGYGTPGPYAPFGQPYGGGYDQGAQAFGSQVPDDTWAQQGYPTPGPNGWYMYRTKEGEAYFHNHRTNVTQWDRPAEWPATGPL